MANHKIADIVVAIPFGRGLPGKRYVTVGSLIELEDNDPKKGPGFCIALDPTFNPAGAPIRDGSVMLSCYHPKPPRQAPEPASPRTHPQPVGPSLDDDDIPF